MKKAFIYVGHSNWGKSFTLRRLTNNSSYVKTININNKWVWVRKMSNDDKPQELLDFVNSIPSNWYQNFILAYCPTHENVNNRIARRILNSLQQSCQLFFFVQERMFSDQSQIIPEPEISYLREIGNVQVLQGHSGDSIRSARFLDFIRENI
jgi:hypothetical protein